jgi:hypothetical protein
MAKDIIRLSYTIEGETPGLLMHNGRLANPLDEMTKGLKEITSKRKKSDEDHVEVMRREWMGGLYFDEEIGPYIPGSCLDAILVEGAKKRKLGKSFKSAVFTDAGEYPLSYDGPRTIAGLWADPKFRDVQGVRVGQARVMRCRPLFKRWALTFSVLLQPSELNPADVTEALEEAGRSVGLCDYRPRYGRFTVKSAR